MAIQQTIHVGGLYASQARDGTWRVSKVLAVDRRAVHLRIYANKFPARPIDLDPATLTLGGTGHPAGLGIGHAPVARDGFFSNERSLIKIVVVLDEELDGYRLYLAGGIHVKTPNAKQVITMPPCPNSAGSSALSFECTWR